MKSIVISTLLASSIAAMTSLSAPVLEKVTPVTKPLPLSKIRLLDGPFLDALHANSGYLLKLDPMRLLHNFHKHAGLKPKGEVYGGWENDTIAGHTLGHYLTACALFHAQTGEMAFKERVDLIVTEIAACQAASGDGYVAGFTRKNPKTKEIEDGKVVFAELMRGEIRSAGFDLNGCWVPFYNWHKLLEGLMDAKELCGNQQALDATIKLADYIAKVFAALDEAQLQKVLDCEYGGLNDSFARLYALTGQTSYLDLAKRIYHNRILDPLAAGNDELASKHANTQIPKVIGEARIHELTNDEKSAKIANFFWETVIENHSYVIGGNADREYFFKPRNISQHLTEQTCESCNTYNMLKLSRHLHSWNGSAKYFDYYERAHLNHILAHQHPKTGMFTYMMPMRSGARREFSTPFDSFWCCVGTGMESHAKHGESVWWTRGEDELIANLYIASEADWTEKQTKIRMEGGFPLSDSMTLQVNPAKATRFTLALRIPEWCADSIKTQITGATTETNESRADGYLRITRLWHPGDKVLVTLPMKLHLEATTDDADTVALLYGPMVLAADLGPADGEQPKLAPAIVTENVLASIEQIEPGQPVFKTKGIGRPEDFTLRPFYGLHDRRHSVYFKRYTPKQWEAHKERVMREEEYRRALDARSVDIVHLGEMQPERDHKLESAISYPVDYRGEKGRDARTGGFFEFTAKCDPKAQLELQCRYWGGEGNRRFDILVDGVKLVTEHLNNEKPNEFIDRVHAIPSEMTNGKQSLQIRFNPHEGYTAGPVFGCRILKK